MNKLKNNNLIFIFVLILLILVKADVFCQKTNEEMREIVPNQIIEREIHGMETHYYQIQLPANQILNINVEQKGVDIILRFLDKDGKVLAEKNNSKGAQGSENYSTITSYIGFYSIEIKGVVPNTDSGKYTIRIEPIRTVNEKDKIKIQADNYYEEANNLINQRNLSGYRTALEKLKQASELYEEIGNKKLKAGCLVNIGDIHYLLSEFKNSINYYNLAISLFQEIGDKSTQADILLRIGLFYESQGEFKEVFKYAQQALQLYRDGMNKQGEGETLNTIGTNYSKLSNYQEAIKYLEQSLDIRREIKDRQGEARTLNNLGRVYDSLGENQKALRYFQLALPIRREINDKKGEAVTLNNIGAVYKYLGEFNNALIYYQKSMQIRKSIGDKSGEAQTLNNIGNIYFDLGDYQKAIQFVTLSFDIYKFIGDKRGEAVSLSAIATIYDLMNRKVEALNYYKQAQLTLQKIGDKKNEANILVNLGGLYNSIGQNAEAKIVYEDSLRLIKLLGDKKAEASVYSSLGKVYLDLSKPEEALVYLYKALPIIKLTGSKDIEAITFKNLALVYKELNRINLSRVFAKMSVNLYQKLRNSAQTVEIETQKSFLKSIREPYELLIELLIEQKQFEQSTQVFNLLHDQQYFDFNQDKNLSELPILYSPKENFFSKQFEENVNSICQIQSQIDEIKRQSLLEKFNNEDNDKIEKLQTTLESAQNNFQKFLQNAEIEFSRTPDKNDKSSLCKNVTEMRDTLIFLNSATKRKTVITYTLIGKEKFHLLLLTANGKIKHFETSIKADDLNNKIKQFHGLLQSDKYDSTILGRQLYDIIFRPIEAELKKEGVQTIMWQLDGNLRYIPMAALFDGKQFLAERFQNVVFTRADKERLTRNVNPNWTGTGFGTSQPQTVDLYGDGDKIPFVALPGVTQELSSIFSNQTKNVGILKGDVFADAKFTKDNFYQALKQKRPVVHISSHFQFRPGDESRSFLLMGDGSALTLNELKKQTDLFQGVDLLTLSACNTAATQADANGKEIDGFAELAQRLGAGAVMATLWQVSDASTPWLMREFYEKRQSQHLTKGEALQKSQLALLNGTAKTFPFPEATKGTANTIKLIVTDDAQSARGAEIVISTKDAPLFKKDPKKPFAHPFYWSPFVLYGNWK